MALSDAQLYEPAIKPAIPRRHGTLALFLHKRTVNALFHLEMVLYYDFDLTLLAYDLPLRHRVVPLVHPPSWTPSPTSRHAVVPLGPVYPRHPPLPL